MADRLDFLVEQIEISLGRPLSKSAAASLDSHRRNHPEREGQGSCRWCKLLKADAAIVRSRFVQG